MRVPAFRQGLCDGDIALSDDRQKRFLQELASRVKHTRPAIWDVPYVWARELRAEAIILRRPGGQIGPKQPVSLRIEHTYTDEEVFEMRAQSITEGSKRQQDIPNAAEIREAEQVMGWTLRYLKHDALAAAAVTHGRRWAVLDRDIGRMIDAEWIGDSESFDRYKRAGLEAIARGLNRDRVAVT